MSSCNYDRIADRYEDLRGGEQRAEQIAAQLAAVLRGPRVLDVGVGTGIIASAFERRGFEVFGIDISSSMLARARPRLPGRIALATGERIPLRDAAFDSAMFVWSIHHIGNAVSALRDAARAVGPVGRVVVVSARSEPQTDEIGRYFMRLNVLGASDRATAANLASLAGLRVVQASVLELRFEQSPNEQAQLIADRGYSPLWDLDDARWREVVQPVIDGLRALPEPHKPRDRVLRQPYHVLTSA